MHAEMVRQYGGEAGIRDEGLLECALARPRNIYAYEDSADIFRLAAAYTFGICRNHPFVDGNKRAGFAAAGVFLLLNGFRLIAEEAESTWIVLEITLNTVSEEDYANWLQKHSVPHSAA